MIHPEGRTSAASKELQAIVDNLGKLWVALRFGNDKFHDGDKAKEARNFQAALKLVEETGNQRGIGI